MLRKKNKMLPPGIEQKKIHLRKYIDFCGGFPIARSQDPRTENHGNKDRRGGVKIEVPKGTTRTTNLIMYIKPGTVEPL